MTAYEPMRIAYHWTPRVCTAYALMLNDAGSHRLGLLADRITYALGQAGADTGDPATTVRVDLTVREAAWVRAFAHPSNRST